MMTSSRNKLGNISLVIEEGAGEGEGEAWWCSYYHYVDLKKSF